MAAPSLIAPPLAAGGNSIVSPSLGLMIWTLLVFFIAVIVLRKFVFPKIQEALDRRQHAIEESIDAADHTRQEADTLLGEYRERLREARRQADEIVERAERAGQQQEHESLEAARAKRDEMLEQTKRDIELETTRAIQEIRREVADLTVAATEKVTRKTLSEDDQRRLVEEALGELDFSTLSGNAERN